MTTKTAGALVAGHSPTQKETDPMNDAQRVRALRPFYGLTDTGFRRVALGEVVDVSKDHYLAAAAANRAEKVDPKTPTGTSKEHAKAA
jgi:hypothetical protein